MKKLPSGLMYFITVLSLLVMGSCNSNKYVVLSDKVVMSVKDAHAYPMVLDSSFQVYDYIRIKRTYNKVIVKNLSRENRK